MQPVEGIGEAERTIDAAVTRSDVGMATTPDETARTDDARPTVSAGRLAAIADLHSAAPAAGVELLRPLTMTGLRGRRTLAAAARRVAPRADPSALARLLERPGARRDLLVAAFAEGRCLAAAMALPCAGRTAQVIASQPETPREVAAVAEALAALCTALRPEEAIVAQALLEEERLESEPIPARSRAPAPAPGSGAGHAGLLASFFRAGFFDLATLEYLVREIRSDESPAVASPPGGVEVIAWRRGDPSLRAVLEASYEQTLDCPGLRGIRPTEDIIEGHLAAGRYQEGLWSLLRVDGRPLGALLLSPSHLGSDLELIYLGLAVAARGRGLGRFLLRHGLRQASLRRERRISLAVDRANAPAVALYRSEGFRKVAVRRALIRPLAGSGAAPVV
ncbi:MAG TPA: GNAT family N-acetyltransferase [Phycisphaerales bacterium]|nr:GNAT family N-acetyltransferase [Phycisphaerales bacterium]HMP37901.1 GNAT family N-acetyltransferase [Phycisphaerales bacterium]